MRNWKKPAGALFGLTIWMMAMGQEPYLKPDGSYISLKGKAVTATPDSFLLDYGEGKITVEMDNWDWYSDAYTALENSRVRVYGQVDDAFFETATIRASGVYVEDLNTYFFIRGPHEESAPVATATVGDYDVKLNGEVASVNGREFELDIGARYITIDTSQLGYNPLDGEGSRRIEPDDRVNVFGDLDEGFFGELRIAARAIIKLEEHESGAFLDKD